nr:hypothetical protein [Corynebacterium glutamicum]
MTIARLDRLTERTSRSRGFYLKAAIRAMLSILEETYWAQQATAYEESVIDRDSASSWTTHWNLRTRTLTPPDDDPPREGGDELLYLLVIDPQAGSHRLHRFTPALEYQTLQIQPPFAPLVPADQRNEDLRDELLECSAHPRDLIPSCRKRPTSVETPTTRANEVLL